MGRRELNAHACTNLWRLLLLDHFPDPLERPVNFFTLDGERRSDADDMIVSLFAEQAFALQSFAVGAGRAVQFNSDPKSDSTNFY